MTLPGTARFLLRSEEIGQDFRIDVALPSDYGETQRRYPVVYMTDSNSMFVLARGATLPLEAVGLLPRFILVGIGWETEDPLGFLTLRNRDLTPTRDPAWEEQARQRPAPWSETHSDLAKKVFLSAGSLEPEELISNTRRMVDRLKSRGYEGLVRFPRGAIVDPEEPACRPGAGHVVGCRS